MTPADRPAWLSDAEEDLEEGDRALDVARRYVHRAHRDGALRSLRGLCGDYSPGAADGVLLEYLLRERRDGDGPPPVAESLEAKGAAAGTRLADVEPENVAWLWPGRVPRGLLTLLDGDPGVGKSTLCLDLAARLSQGAPLPDGSEADLDGPAGTVLLTAEDGLAETVRPRLDAAGADPSRIFALQQVHPEGDGEPRPPTVADVAAIREACGAVEAALIVVDPLAAYLPPDANAHRDADVRRALRGLAGLAEELEVGVLAVRHLTKSGGPNPIYRGGGSIGLIAAARSGLLAAEDPDGEGRVLASSKCNLAPEPPALRYRLEEADNGAVRVRWEGEAGRSARDLLSAPDPEERTAREAAERYLRGELSEGPRPVAELRAVADDLGLSWSTVRRAKNQLGVDAERRGFGEDGRWWWRLPEGSP